MELTKIEQVRILIEEAFQEDLRENPFEKQVAEDDFERVTPTEKQLEAARKEFIIANFL